MTLLVGSIFHMTRKIVSEMTYNVSMGTLNPTIPYHTCQLQYHVNKTHSTILYQHHITITRAQVDYFAIPKKPSNKHETAANGTLETMQHPQQARHAAKPETQARPESSDVNQLRHTRTHTAEIMRLPVTEWSHVQHYRLHLDTL